jgi:hypothetical protein
MGSPAQVLDRMAAEMRAYEKVTPRGRVINTLERRTTPPDEPTVALRRLLALAKVSTEKDEARIADFVAAVPIFDLSLKTAEVCATVTA